MAHLPSRLERKASFLPSGDQVGATSTARLSVSRVSLPPEAPITYNSQLPERAEIKATRLPSGDQAGAVSLGSVVRRAGLKPPAFITHTPHSSPRSLQPW